MLSEISSQEKNLEALHVAIADKEAPLKMAQTRLMARSQRPSWELCHDPVQVRLLEEVQELMGHIDRSAYLPRVLFIKHMRMKLSICFLHRISWASDWLLNTKCLRGQGSPHGVGDGEVVEL